MTVIILSERNDMVLCVLINETLVIKLTEYNFTPTKTGLSSDRQSGSRCEALVDINNKHQTDGNTNCK